MSRASGKRMGHFLLSADATFSAAHTLPGIEMCERMHGHNWRVRLTVRVDEGALDQVGMGVDFRVVEKIARDVVADFEHRYLNELEPFRKVLPRRSTSHNWSRNARPPDCALPIRP